MDCAEKYTEEFAQTLHIDEKTSSAMINIASNTALNAHICTNAAVFKCFCGVNVINQA